LRRRRSPLIVALAAVLALAVALAVPDARSSLLRLLHLDGVTVIRVDELPRLPTTAATDQLGTKVSLVEAQQRVPFDIVGPPAAVPSAVFVGEDRPPQVALVYGALTRPRLIVTQFKPCCGQDAITKEVPKGTLAEGVSVAGAHGVWIAGRHVTETTHEARLAGNVLIWEKRGIIYRVEGRLTLDRALELAASLAPLR
jgi:hypothetical protein